MKVFVYRVVFALVLMVSIVSCDLFGPAVPVTAVTITTTENRLALGTTLALTGLVEPSEVRNQSIIWTSSDETIATIDLEGVVTPLKAGLVTITAKSSADPSISSTKTIAVGLSETFTNPGNWTQRQTGLTRVWTADGRYHLETDYSDGVGPIVYVRPSIANTRFSLHGPYELAIDVILNAADQVGGSASIELQFNSTRYYDSAKSEYVTTSETQVNISSSGDYSVSQATNGVNQAIQGWTTSSAIHTDGTVNRIVIRQSQTNLIITCNGVDLGTFVVAPLTTTSSESSYFNFFVWENTSFAGTSVSKVVIDNLDIYPFAQ